MDVMVEAIDVRKRFGKVLALDGLTMSAPGGPGRRRARTQRRRQDDVRAHGGDAEPARRRRRPRRRDRRARPTRSGSESHRARRPARRGRGGDDWSREPRDDRPPVRPQPQGEPAPCRRVLDRARPRRRRRAPGARLVRWHAPPSRPRCQPRRRATAAPARRADDRTRPGEPDRPVGCGPRPRRGRDRRADDHPVPRRGRPARRPDRDHRPRPRDRHRYPVAAQGASRPRRHRGPRSAPRRRRIDRGIARQGHRQQPTRRRRVRAGCRSQPATGINGLADIVDAVRASQPRCRRPGAAPPDARRGVPRPHRRPTERSAA